MTALHAGFPPTFSASARDARSVGRRERGSRKRTNTPLLLLFGSKHLNCSRKWKSANALVAKYNKAKSADPYVTISPSMRAKPCPFFAAALFQELKVLALPSKRAVKPGSITRASGRGKTFAVSLSDVRWAKAMPVSMGLGEPSAGKMAGVAT